MKKDNNVNDSNEKITLDDERRVKVLSPSALVARRFLRNKLAIVGLAVIVFMFLFSFVGPFFSPYSEYQVFTANQIVNKELANAATARTLRFTSATNESVSSSFSGAAYAAIISGSDSFNFSETDYTIEAHQDKLYIINAVAEVAVYNSIINNAEATDSEFVVNATFNKALGEAIRSQATSFRYDNREFQLVQVGKNYSIRTVKLVAMASYYVYNAYVSGADFRFNFKLAAETILLERNQTFEADGIEYRIKNENDRIAIDVLEEGEYIPYANLSEIFIQPVGSDAFIDANTKTLIENAIKNGDSEISVPEQNATYKITGENGIYKIKSDTLTQVIDVYSAPSAEHFLGTDANGMDIFTRLMYGGRISLLIGFIVVAIETLIGVILGGIAGYFGGVADNIIMRLVDIFNCIPTLPLFIIIGAIMDGLKLDPQIRIYMLMLVLGIFSWPSIARLVRGQILSLREQEFMVATEATGIKVRRRIFRHLIPNVIPQLIVMATMGLGSIILTESTLSFFGLGVKYPFASWGNIINAVTSIQVMTNYLFVWIPAGVCILLTVLGFNFVGDGLRDAFDPKMKK